METLLGQTLLAARKGDPSGVTVGTAGAFPSKSTKEVFQDKDFVLLYFSASWCPPCRAFTPLLIDFYNVFARANRIEIVYLSSDRTLEEFNGYYGKMPWMAVPSDPESVRIKKELADRLQIRGIPCLVVLEVSTGLFITNQGRQQVQTVVGSTNRQKAVADLVQEWKGTEAKTLEEGATAAAGGGSFLGKLFMWIVQNPIVLVGLVYTYKLLVRYWSQPTPTAVTGDGADSTMAQTIQEDALGGDDSEF